MAVTFTTGKRAVLAALLGACALLLSLAPLAGRRTPARGAGEGEASAAASAAVDSLLPRFGAGGSTVRSWKAMAAGAPTGRIEERITVPASFRSLEFNHALARRLAPLGMSLVATEHARENSVTMHIVRRGFTIRTLAFVADAQH